MSFWRDILGLEPSAQFKPNSFEKKCYQCESTNVKKLPSGPWSGKYKCVDCGNFTYVIFADRHGGDGADHVAVDHRESSL